ncbi:tyrosine-type recombinase/integrase [Microbacterium sp. ASV81]|uniref:Tyrosine-type recombinase/integrase n=1 Tax=Microbacterium capsulatum TaxID=3041921 RepID=A0ABU0XDZ0_9MICO|nr:tyrosine-type recombinase/integrase [Microbacterium sp. ASV81]MDQ4213298.1 tyrosine-type recombinase/integrase [Microbacterium sp. ASV81]
MSNTALLAEYRVYLLGSDRRDGTIALRLREIEKLAITHDLRTVTEDDLIAILAQRRHQAPETRKSMRASWRVFFEWAHRKGHRADDPTIGIRPIRIPARVPRIADDAAILAALGTENPHYRAMILLGRGGWLRLSEIASLHTSSRTGRMLTIRGKGGKERSVSINDEVAAALDVLEPLQGPGYYFPGSRGRAYFHPISVNKIITRLTGYNPHALRHAGATAAWRKTRDLRTIQDMLGHASIRTTQIYVHTDDEQRRAVADASLLR